MVFAVCGSVLTTSSMEKISVALRPAHVRHDGVFVLASDSAGWARRFAGNRLIDRAQSEPECLRRDPDSSDLHAVVPLERRDQEDDLRPIPETGRARLSPSPSRSRKKNFSGKRSTPAAAGSRRN